VLISKLQVRKEWWLEYRRIHQ